jgi:glycosyltransferase involved in cell wall biosynthesis
MKIAFDARPLVKYKTGIGKYTENLLRHICDISSDSELLLFSNKEISFNKEKNVEYAIRKRLFGKYNSSLWFQLSLPFYLNSRSDNKIDLFHGTMAMLPLAATVPMVITIYDLVLEKFPETMYWKNWLSLKTLMRASARKALKIIAISENTKKDIMDCFGIEDEKIRVIYLGVDRQFSPQPDPNEAGVLSKYNLPSGYILSVGTLEPRKNILRLINAYKMVASSGEPVPKLVIVGGHGWRNEDLGKLVRESGLADRVVLVGYVPDEDLPTLYRNATVFVYPSLYEGFGLPPLEAMACGTPVITSNLSSIPEVVGDAGIVIDPYNTTEIARAIASVLNNEELRESLRTSGLVRSRLFNWDKTALETLKLYQEVIEESKAKRHGGHRLF